VNREALTNDQRQIIDRIIAQNDPSEGLSILGEGGYRVVYRLGEGLVLKFVKRVPHAREHHMTEISLSRQLPKLTALTFAASPEYIIAEECRQARLDDEWWETPSIQERYARLRYHFKDAAKLHNVGYSTRDGEMQLVMLDSGSGLKPH
jgi:hypothetical protein